MSDHYSKGAPVIGELLIVHSADLEQEGLHPFIGQEWELLRVLAATTTDNASRSWFVPQKSVTYGDRLIIVDKYVYGLNTRTSCQQWLGTWYVQSLDSRFATLAKKKED